MNVSACLIWWPSRTGSDSSRFTARREAKNAALSPRWASVTSADHGAEGEGGREGSANGIRTGADMGSVTVPQAPQRGHVMCIPRSRTQCRKQSEITIQSSSVMMGTVGGLHGPFPILNSRADKGHGPQPLAKFVVFDRNTELVKSLCFML
jgi:hypothetical protein